MTDEFGRSLAEILSVRPESVGAALALNDDNWDSMAMISAIALIDETYGITVPVERLVQCGSVGDLMTLIESMLPGSPAAGR